MNITKTVLEYYHYKKIPKLGKHYFKFKFSIHEVINIQLGFKTDSKHHNDIAYLGLLWSNYKRGFITRSEFIDRLSKRKYVNKYLKHFKEE